LSIHDAEDRTQTIGSAVITQCTTHSKLEHTNRNFEGNVDFERCQASRGIVMANIVDNWEKVPKFISWESDQDQISFDDAEHSSP